jgi:hypothetical protein
MQKKTIPQATIPQHVLERMESEWRQMRPVHETAPKPAAPQPAE